MCGCPLTENFSVESGEFCRLRKSLCPHHPSWEKTRRALIDLQKVQLVSIRRGEAWVYRRPLVPIHFPLTSSRLLYFHAIFSFVYATVASSTGKVEFTTRVPAYVRTYVRTYAPSSCEDKDIRTKFYYYALLSLLSHASGSPKREVLLAACVACRNDDASSFGNRA